MKTLASLLATCAVVCAAPAFAQTAEPQASAVAADPASSNDDGEIIVTANRRAENVQQVAASISVISGEKLGARGIVNS